jgi:hypothetical protein
MDEIFDVEHTLLDIKFPVPIECDLSIRGGTGQNAPEDVRYRDDEPVCCPGVGEFLHFIVRAKNGGNEQNTRKWAIAIGIGIVARKRFVVSGRIGNLATRHCRLPEGVTSQSQSADATCIEDVTLRCSRHGVWTCLDAL